MSTIICKGDRSNDKTDPSLYLSNMSKQTIQDYSMESRPKQNTLLDDKTYDALCSSYKEFMLSCRHDETHFSLTPNTKSSPFALCFAIFGSHLIRKTEEIFINTEKVIVQLKTNLEKYRNFRSTQTDLKFDKPYLQLLTLTLSCFDILDGLEKDPLESFVVPYLTDNVEEYLNHTNALEGVAQSGNKAMFAAILLVHAKDYLGLDTQNMIDSWIELHLSSMNKFGFWGNNRDMSFLQFQNGYHQYEIFEYLNVDNPKKEIAAFEVEKLMDKTGHYAPYPGGGGCYDYDAITILTGSNTLMNNERYNNLLLSFNSILSEQNSDGGFCESHCVHPVLLNNIYKAIDRIRKLKGTAKYESMRLCAAVFSPRHRRIHTHWSEDSRRWNESNLWDSWFRILALVRIEIAFNPSTANRWGFINYPGIGYHYILMKH